MTPTPVKVKATPLQSAAAHAMDVVKVLPTPTTPPPRKAPRGRPVAAAMFATARFRRSLETALESVRAEIRDLGVASEATLRAAIVEAHRRLGKSRTTATDWVGAVFEIIGADLAEVRYLMDEAAGIMIGLVNNHVGTPGKPFVDGYGRPVAVRRGFTPGVEIVDVRIKRPSDTTGALYIDRGRLATGGAQRLLISTEFKTRGAAGDLKGQTTQRNVRLLGGSHPEGTVITYRVVDRKTGLPGPERSTDLASLVLVEGAGSPVLREAAAFSRIGVRAGKRYRAAKALDDNGDPYIRIVAPVETDPLRRVLEKLLRDRSWQR